MHAANVGDSSDNDCQGVTIPLESKGSISQGEEQGVFIANDPEGETRVTDDDVGPPPDGGLQAWLCGEQD